MSNVTIRDFFKSSGVQNRFNELLGKNAASFTTSVLQIVNSNNKLSNADPHTLLSAAMMAATLNLPVNQNLGFAYIIPYEKSQGKNPDGSWKPKIVEAQFQLGYKGFIQLAQRSGQFKRINACATYSEDTEQSVYERLTSFLPKPPQGEITGYIAYFQLLNGFEAHLAMSLDEIKQHAKKYSKSYKYGSGVWADNFEAMAQKTVIKLLLSKQAPLSIDAPLAQAVQADQAVIRDVDGQTSFEYADNQPEPALIQMDISNDPQIYNNVINSIKGGDLDKVDVLRGKAGYILSEQQRSEISAL
ncbi:recombinase RecT [Psychrobacter pygoscelis]|uniref:recombinase RecT n=1 Tax=Psychrobacter pygoscelis TaxID=2488563 RepID=UPI00103DD5CB|nr:recombinase RecT [Psychrobacter pygoscelis]